MIHMTPTTCTTNYYLFAIAHAGDFYDSSKITIIIVSAVVHPLPARPNPTVPFSVSVSTAVIMIVPTMLSALKTTTESYILLEVLHPAPYVFCMRQLGNNNNNVRRSKAAMNHA